jgi:hypothetical protein
MSGYLQRVLLELLNNLEYGLTPLRAAQMLWGNNATDANRNAVRRALSALERRGLAHRDLGGIRYYANSRAVLPLRVRTSCGSRRCHLRNEDNGEADAGTRQLPLDVDPGSTIQVHVEQQAQGAIVIVDRGEKCLG